MRAHLLLAVVTTASCSQASIPPVRFANAKPVRVVNDRSDVDKPPARRGYLNALYHFNGSFRRRVTRLMDLPPERRARGVNSLDEVPDSTWFTNRIGIRELTPDEVRTGPIAIESPQAHTPWTVTRSKLEGQSLGFFITDARGEKFLIKFDPKGKPEIETAAHVITGRLLWAAGYNVPEDFIARVRRVDLRVAGDATWTDRTGRKQPYTQKQLDAALRNVEVARDGTIRVLASRMLPGRMLGGHPDEGVRADDPNDRIAHELRRDLRGARPIFAWLDHVDVKESNTADVWVADTADPTRHYVRHYWLDFGKSLGAMAAIARDATRGYEYSVDYGAMFGALVTLGARPHAWEGRRSPGVRGVGLYERSFDPRRWKPSTQAYRPFLESDIYDWLWGTKIVLRFSPDHLRAAVSAGELSDPRAAQYLVETLLARQRALARHVFSQIRPLDGFTIEADRALCFDDLVFRHRLSRRVAETRYDIATYDRRGRSVGRPVAVGATREGRTCASALPIARGSANYTIWRVTTRSWPGTTYVHAARDPVTAQLRVIGIWRE